MPASALLAAASVASLNLCSDEYLLLLARPAEIASVSFLSQDPLESRLWRRARAYRPNRGSLEEVVGSRPKVVLTMGGGGRASAMIARRLGIRSVSLSTHASLSDVEANFRLVATALGEPRRADAWVKRLRHLRATAPARPKDAIWISGGGDSIAPGTIGAEWMRLAGLRQRPLPGGRADLETLLVRPPQLLVRSNYRSAQVSRGGMWLRHPIVRKLESRQAITDGRAWTCMGPLLIAEIARLRKVVR